VATTHSKTPVNTKPTVLLTASEWWPLAARLAVALDRHGCRVEALCPRHHLLEQVPVIRKTYRYGALDSLGHMRRALKASRPDLVIPCDDGAVAQLHAMHAREPALRPVIERSLGPRESYPVIEGRYELLRLADSRGIRVPRFRKIERARDLEDWHENVSSIAVVKLDGDTGGVGVCLSGSLDASLAAFERFRRPSGTATAVKRAIVDRDPLALWRSRSGDNGVSVQEFITGPPANSMLACWNGKLIGIMSVAVVASAGATGVATVVRIIDNDEMKAAAELIASHLNLSGFYGLDFVIEPATGLPYLIELNPRCTQLGHIERPGVGSLAGMLCEALIGTPLATPNRPIQPIRSDVVALFPQALQAGNACSAFIEMGHHDIPDDAGLGRELMKPIWPMRQWPSRLYHAFRPPLIAEPALVETAEAPAQTMVRNFV
jgi:hypothetical protein